MGNLRDQLKKANIISEKKARQLAHDERVHRKAAGHEGVERERQEREKELAQIAAQERARTARAQAQLDEERSASAEQAACRQILADESVAPSGGGQRFYFEIDGGELPWLELDESTARRVRAGELCIVRAGAGGAHVYRLLAADATKRVFPILPERIAWAPRGVLPR